MRFTASIFANDGRTLLGTAELEISCSTAFCDTCGDCLVCQGEDACARDGGHSFVVYEDDLPQWFGELEPRPAASNGGQ